MNLPDDSERAQVILAIAKLFAYHHSFSDRIITLIINRFEELKFFDVEYHFFYNDILAIFRTCIKVYFLNDWEEGNENIGEQLGTIFLTQFMPLLRLSSIQWFSSQWAFLFEETQKFLDFKVAFQGLKRNLFYPTGDQFNHDRDLSLFSIYEDIYREVEFPDDCLPEYIKFLLDQAATLRIRPRVFRHRRPLYKL